MRSNLQLQKELLSPPGDTIQETIDAIGMSQVELAERIGRPKEKLNGLIKGIEPLTLKTAVLLERVLGIPVEFWMEREKEYRIELSKIEQEEFLNGCVDWLKKFPVKELKKMGWLPNITNQNELVSAMLRFFEVATPVEWERIYLSEAVSASFKISLANTKSPYAISAWIRIGELKAKQYKFPEFERSAFLNLLQEIKLLVAIQPTDFKEQLLKKCALCGVIVLYTPCLPEAPIAGATWWKKGNPIIQLTERHKTNDSFWFAFFHEAAHILKHGKKDIFLEDLEGTPMNKEKELEADSFAQKQLFPAEGLSAMRNRSLISEQDILEFATKYKTHPGIIVGQLQHAGIIPFNRFKHLKTQISIFN